jgi:hypothetical protein
MVKNKQKAIELVKKKNNGETTITYDELTRITGYSKMQLIRFSKLIEEKDVDDLLTNGNKDKKSNNSASNKELDYIIKFKQQHPIITISQFMDVYHEDVIWNKSKIKDVTENNLKLRSKSFYQQLFYKQGWKSPIKQRNKKELSVHPLREASPRIGMLLMLDGTPHDWFSDGNKLSLHLALDDATGEIMGGYFLPTERLLGYSYLLYYIVRKHGIPISIYSDKHTIFKSPKEGELTQFGRMCEELGIQMIFANTPQAKGKIERMNYTLQNRLIVDLKRNGINSNEINRLNDWFNKRYIAYINDKFAYEAREEDSEYVPLPEEIDLSLIFCLKEERKVLNGNMISYGNKYYRIDSKEALYRGTRIIVMKDIFQPKLVRVKHNKNVYSTEIMEGNLQDPIKRQMRINNMKELNEVIDKTINLPPEERAQMIQEVINKSSKIK